MADPARPRACRPLLVTLLGVLWIALTFATCSTFHADPVPGAGDFDSTRNGVLVLYSLISIHGASWREATLVLSGLLTAGAVVTIGGIVMAVRQARRR